jgi:hypothetical protein
MSALCLCGEQYVLIPSLFPHHTVTLRPFPSLQDPRKAKQCRCTPSKALGRGHNERWMHVRATHVISNGRWVSSQTSVALRAFVSFKMHVIKVVWPFYLALRIFKKRNRSINSKRYIHGQCYTLYPPLREYSNKFCNYFRKSPASFDEFLCHKELCNA